MREPTDVEVEQFAREVTAFLAAHADPIGADSTRWGHGSDEVPLLEGTSSVREAEELGRARAWRRTVFDAGFGWLAGPSEFGGAGRHPMYERVYRDLESTFDVPSTSYFAVAMHMLAPAILHHGTDHLKARYLRGIFRGDLLATQLFSEPGAGSDLASLSTRAHRDGDDWIVTGQKVWSSHAHLSQVGELLARTDPSVAKHHGLTMFALDMDLPGITVRPLREMNGGAHFNEVWLDEVRVPDSARIGEPGEGWRVARTTLLSERGAVGSGQTNPLAPYVRRLSQLATHLGHDDEPVTRQALAGAYVQDQVLRLLAEQADADDPPAYGSMSKLLLSRHLTHLANTAGELLGPAMSADTGEWGTFAWADFLLTAPALRIAGGTDEIQMNIIGEQLLGLPREPRPCTHNS